MLDSLSPRRRRFVLSVAAAVVIAIVAVAAFLYVRALNTGHSAAQDELGPVLLLPGYGGNVAALEPLADEVRDQGRVAVVVRPPGNGTGDLRAEADHLSDVAHRTLERTGGSAVDVIGFSAGGVVARLWVRDGDGDRLARRVLTLGSPHHGTSTAGLAQEVVGRCALACEQLVPDSDLLRQLNAGDESPDGPRWITVRSTSDTTVTPTGSASLTGALDILVQDICPDAKTLHGGLPSDPVSLALITSALGPGPPRRPDDVSC